MKGVMDYATFYHILNVSSLAVADAYQKAMEVTTATEYKISHLVSTLNRNQYMRDISRFYFRICRDRAINSKDLLINYVTDGYVDGCHFKVGDSHVCFGYRTGGAILLNSGTLLKGYSVYFSDKPTIHIPIEFENADHTHYLVEVISPAAKMMQPSWQVVDHIVSVPCNHKTLDTLTLHGVYFQGKYMIILGEVHCYIPQMGQIIWPLNNISVSGDFNWNSMYVHTADPETHVQINSSTNELTVNSLTGSIVGYFPIVGGISSEIQI